MIKKRFEDSVGGHWAGPDPGTGSFDTAFIPERLDIVFMDLLIHDQQRIITNGIRLLPGYPYDDIEACQLSIAPGQCHA